MPGTSSPHPHQRRPGAVTRGRENRPQTPIGEASRRRRSRSPEPWTVEDVNSRPEPTAIRRKRKATVPHPHPQPSTSSAHSHAHSKIIAKAQRDSATPIEQPSADSGPRRTKGKHRPSSDDVEIVVIQDIQSRATGKSRRKERSRSRDASNRLSTKATSVEDSDDDNAESKSYSGSLASADYMRTKTDLEKAHKDVKSFEKKMHKQSKEIDRLRKELALSQQSNAEHCSQLDKLRKQSKKSAETISTIEGHMSCNICMDLMLKPFGLAPCGHVLCQSCLQEWFRTAPAGEDDMFDDDTPEALLYRKKTCPVCRTVVRTRPIPLFVVKSIANALASTKPNSPRRALTPPNADSDPWAGIFLDPAEEDGESDDDESDDDDEDDYDEYDQWSSDADGYGSADDSEPYNGQYTFPRWSPPTVNVSPLDLHFLDTLTGEELSMLRRGCTLQMIQLFDMHYTHDAGLQATVDGNLIYLGWNIRLLPEDDAGEDYMEWVMRDIHERDDRWDKHDKPDGTFEAWRMIREELAADDDTMDEF
ncbi:unnamed protein product [Somion occarium]|uniref:RING-type domain-containing protein n=1 Tax=Somion occarium TaxID=3059160 RepID=A0ABP1E6J4_9APHY